MTYALIFLGSFINITNNISFFLSESGAETKSDFSNEMWAKMIQLLLLMGFSKIILNYQIYKHQIFSMLFILLGMGTVTLLGVRLTFSPTMGGISFYSYLSSVFYVVLKKYVIEKKYILPLALNFYMGGIGSVTCLIGAIFNYFIPAMDMMCKYKTYNVKETLSVWNFIIKDPKYIMQHLLYILFYVGYELFALFTLIYYKPAYFSIIDTIETFIVLFFSRTIFDLCDGGNSQIEIVRDWAVYVGFIIVMIGNLIYNEIIILMFCGLDKNTNLEINERSVYEIEDINKELSLGTITQNKSSIGVFNDVNDNPTDNDEGKNNEDDDD